MASPLDLHVRNSFIVFTSSYDLLLTHIAIDYIALLFDYLSYIPFRSFKFASTWYDSYALLPLMVNKFSNFLHGKYLCHVSSCTIRRPLFINCVNYQDFDFLFVTMDLQSSGRFSKAGGVTYFDRYGHLDSDSHVELKPIDGASKPYFRRTLRTRNVTTDPKRRFDIFSDAEQEESLDIEEGQIISEEMNGKLIKREITCSDKSEVGEMKNFANDKNVEGQDNPKILEIMAKMEKRRERFKQPIALKIDSKNVSKPSVDPFAVLTETMQPRPARRRRWVASEAN